MQNFDSTYFQEFFNSNYMCFYSLLSLQDPKKRELSVTNIFPRPKMSKSPDLSRRNQDQSNFVPKQNDVVEYTPVETLEQKGIE